MNLKIKISCFALFLALFVTTARAAGSASTQVSGISGEVLATTDPSGHLTASSYALSLGGGSGGTGTIPLCTSADDPSQDSIFSALARNLGDDPIRIYEWVRNNIRTEFYYGAQRGALMTYSDRAGNDIDQCSLLGALLRAAGYTPTYYLGSVTLPRTTDDPNGVGAYSWLGVSSDAGALSLLRSLTPSAVSDGIQFTHMWVSVKITATRTVKFLPSIKPHTNGSRQDIASLASNSYSLTKARTAAAATFWTGVTSSAISSSGLRTYLSDLTIEVSDKLHGSPTLHDLSGPDLAGLRMIVPAAVVVTAPSNATSFPSGVTYATDASELTGIPQAVCSMLTINMGENYQRSFFSPDLLGRPLAVEFDGNGVAILRLGGAEVDGNARDAAGGPNDSISVKIRYDFPAAFNDGAPLFAQGSATFIRQKAVVLSYAFGRTSYRLRDHEQKLAMREAEGTASTDTDRLQTIGLQYQSQSNELMVATSAYLGCEAYAQIVCGFISIKNNKPKVDFPISHTPTVARAGANGGVERNVFFTAGLIEGALEGTALEQSATARGYGMPTLFDYAMTQSRGATLISSVAQLNAAKTAGTLQHCDDSNLGGGSMANIENALNNGGKVVLLSDSAPFSISNSSSSGSTSLLIGYLVLGSGKSMQTILGTAYGGGTAGETTTDTAGEHVANSSEAATSANQVHDQTGTTDPVDLTTGAFFRSDVDITVGQKMPLGLQLVRSYNGALRFSDPVKLGRGWTHNFNMRVVARHPSDFDNDRTGIDELLPTLVAAKLIYDAVTDEGETAARTWLIASVAATWACDQQLRSRAAVTMGERTMEFVRRPDGSYTAPGSVKATLASAGGAYTLSIRHGETIQFRASDGKFEQVTDQFGSAITAHYDASGSIDWVKDAFGRGFYFNYMNGQLTTVDEVISGAHTTANITRTVGYSQESDGLHVTDSEGRTTIFKLDGNRRLTEVVDGRRRTVVWNNYDAWNRVDKQHILGDETRLNRIRIAPGIGAEVDATGKAVWTYFDARGRKIFVVNQAGELAQWHYDGADRLTDMATPAGRITSYEYDANHNLTKETNPAGDSRTIEYDTALRPWKVKNFEGQITEFGYNAQHKVTSITAPGGIVSTFEYNTTGNGKGQLYRAHPAAHAANKYDYYTYDAWGNIDTIKHAVANATDSAPVDNYDYSARGDLIQLIDRRGVKTTFDYNKRRQQTSVSVWDGATAHTSTTSYDAAGDVELVADASGRKVATEHNALGDVTEVRQGPLNGEGRPTQLMLTNVYNTRNLLAEAWVTLDGQLRKTYYDYYDTQVVAAVTDPLGRITTFGYDSDLRRTSVQTPLGAAAQPPYAAGTGWNSNGLKDNETDAEGNQAKFTYDKDGRSDTLKNRLLKTFTWSYDDANRKVTTSTPTGKTTVSILNTRGLPASVQKPSDPVNSPSTNFTEYDDEGRLKARSDGVGAAQISTVYSYHANGLLHTVKEDGKTTTRTYDYANRLASYNDGEGHTLGYTYDAAGRLKTLTYETGKTVTYTYDDFGRLWKVKDWNNRETVYTYWENGLLKKIERPNGTVREQSYDAAGQLRYVRETKAGVFFAFQELRYDADGRIEYSFLHPMPAPITLPFDNMDYDVDNRLSSFNGGAVSFDDDGNMTRGPGVNGVVPATANFTYDPRNRLTSHGGSSYRYNPDGLRVEVTGTGACTYVVDPNTALSRTLTRTKNGVTTYYIYGVGLLYECDASGNSARYYHADQVGSTVALTDASGTITDRWSYSPFGTEFRVGTGTSDTPFRFNGEFGVMTEAGGLIYMRNRYYDPRIMRFINADPLKFRGGLNWFLFTKNMPTLFVDPVGLWQVTFTAAYGYGISISFGNNAGQKNFSIAAGIGIGIAGEFNPNDNAAGFTGKAESHQSLVAMASIGVPQMVEFGGSLEGGISAFSVDGESTFIGSQATFGANNAYIGGTSWTATSGAVLTKDSITDGSGFKSNGWSAQAGGVVFAGYKGGLVWGDAQQAKPKPESDSEEEFGRLVVLKPFTVKAKKK